MKYSSKIYAQALFLALANVSKSEQQVIIDRLAKMLSQSSRQELLPEIERELASLEELEKGQGTLHITFARTGLDEKTVKRKLEPVFGKRTTKVHIDNSILGGVIAETDEGKRLDASLARALKQLKMELIS